MTAAMATTFPYLTIPDEAVRFDRWIVGCGNALPSIDPLELPDWSYHQRLSVAATVTIPHEEIRKHLRLSADAQLGTLITWHCRSTQSRGASLPVPVMGDTTTTRLSLVDAPLGGMLTLSLQLVLLDEGSGPADPLSPSVPGAILWTTKHSVALEGDAARFPTAKADFSDSRMGFPKAHWWLELNIDEDALDAPSDSAMRLWLNEASSIAKPLLDGSANAPLVLTMITSDVYRQLVHAALEIESFSIQADYGIGSIGETLQMLLLALDYPDINLARAAANQDATRFDALIQSAVSP